MSHFLGDDDDDFVLAGVEAYNNFLFDEFCAPDPNRLIGLAQIPSLGDRPGGRRAAQGEGARRARACVISNWPAGQENLSTRRRPVLGGGGRRGHPGRGAHQHHQPQAAGRVSARRRPKGGNALYDMSSEATRAKAIGGMSHVFSMAPAA